MTDRQPALTRRDWLRLGLVAGPAAVVAACGWDGGPVLEPKLRAFSRVNDWLGEKVLLSNSRLAPQYPVSARTTDENFPAYSITYNDTGNFPSVPKQQEWMLEIGGLVRQPLRLSLAQIQALPRVTYTVKHHCVEGWTAIGTWTGVSLATVAGLAAPTAAAKYLQIGRASCR